MQVQSVNNRYNSPNFGIKYIDPRSWNPEVLDTLMKSDLVKQIDSKYPKAKVEYERHYGNMSSFKTLNFNLNNVIKSKIFGEVDSELIKEINSTSLGEMEQRFEKKLGKEKAAKQFATDVYKAAEESNAKLTKETRKNIFERFINIFK